MMESTSPRRRQLLLFASTALVAPAGLVGSSQAAAPLITSLVPGLSKQHKPPNPYSLPDYTNNPFVRPIGQPKTPAEQAHQRPSAFSGPGIDQ